MGSAEEVARAARSRLVTVRQQARVCCASTITWLLISAGSRAILPTAESNERERATNESSRERIACGHAGSKLRQICLPFTAVSAHGDGLPSNSCAERNGQVVDEEDLLKELVSKLGRRRRQAADDEEIRSIDDERLHVTARLAALRSAKTAELRGTAGRVTTREGAGAGGQSTVFLPAVQRTELHAALVFPPSRWLRLGVRVVVRSCLPD